LIPKVTLAWLEEEKENKKLDDTIALKVNILMYRHLHSFTLVWQPLKVEFNWHALSLKNFTP